METFGTQNQQKLASDFYCKKCDYYTSKKYNYECHVATDKHKRITLEDKRGQKLAKTSSQMPENQQESADDTTSKVYECQKCGKTYSHRQGLWKHKKTCIPVNLQSHTELVQYLMKENAEFKQLMIEQNKTIMKMAENSGHHNNNTTNNTNNNNFNLNFYLNETCKNAMNIMDFVSQLNVSISDLEETGRLGYVNGISRIFINGLKQINVNERPIHCSDLKRETLYIKDNNEWNKDTEDKTMLTNAIKHVAHKNMKQIPEWTKLHPKYNDSESRDNDRYLKIVCESMSGSSDIETNKNYSKI